MCYNMCIYIYIVGVYIYIYLDIDRRIIFVYTHINMYIYIYADRYHRHTECHQAFCEQASYKKYGKRVVLRKPICEGDD